MSRVTSNLAAVGFATGLGLAGCSHDPSSPSHPQVIVYPPLLYAVTAPESVAMGDSIALIIHFRAGGCISPEPIRLDPMGPRHVRATVRARDVVDGLCPANVDYGPVSTRMRLDDPGTWTIDVVGEDTARVAIEVGASPRRTGIHHFQFDPRNGKSSPAQVEVMWQRPEHDTVAVDMSGQGSFELPCEPGGERNRYIIVSSGFSFYEFSALAEDCTQAMRTRIFR